MGRAPAGQERGGGFCERWRGRARFGGTVASAVALATGALVALASSPALGGPAPATASSAAAPPHVMVVMMENTSYKQVMGKRNEPFAKALAKHNGLATKSYAAGHPSLPNYLALVSGSTEGVTDDGSPSSHSFPSVRTVADQLHAAGYTAEAFAEDLPAHPSADSGYYVVHHDPWEYFPDTSITVASATALSTALNSAHPPDFVWFTPNVMDDGDGETTEAASLTGQNAFLSSFIPSVQATAWYRAGGQIVIEWDESLATDASGINGGDGGHVATVVVSAVNEVTRPKVRTTVDTVGVLHSIEWRYGLPYLAGAAASANGNIDGLLAPTVTLARRAAHSAR